MHVPIPMTYKRVDYRDCLVKSCAIRTINGIGDY